MEPIPRVQKSQVIAAALLLLLLACGPLNRLQALNRQSRALATGVAIIGENKNLVVEAYQNLQRLPGYRLESQSIVRDSVGNLSSLIIISNYDSKGNVHTLTQTPDGRQDEIYSVDGHTYVFEAQYNGWVDLSAVTPVEIQQPNNPTLASLSQVGSPIQLLSRFGGVPLEAGHETLQNRPVTRYELQYVVADFAEVLGDAQTTPDTDLQGTLWIDDETEALLKLEILFYENRTDQPSQEFLLETSEIGNIAPVDIPAPVVDPVAIVSATATAQAWSVLKVKFDYQGEPITFELVPVQISQVPDSSPLSAEVQLILRNLPNSLLTEADAEPFLTQFHQQLTLSIPQHNLIVTSSGFRLESIDSQNYSMEVICSFNADLEDFNHVELILSSMGNPQFVPIPVAGK
jgi:hypothetical protein